MSKVLSEEAACTAMMGESPSSTLYESHEALRKERDALAANLALAKAGLERLVYYTTASGDVEHDDGRRVNVPYYAAGILRVIASTASQSTDNELARPDARSGSGKGAPEPVGQSTQQPADDGNRYPNSAASSPTPPAAGTRTPGAISPRTTAVNDSSKATSTVNSYASGYRAQPAGEAKCRKCHGTGDMLGEHGWVCTECAGRGFVKRKQPPAQPAGGR